MCLAFYTILLLSLSSLKQSYGKKDYGEVKFFDLSTTYTVENTILLNDINKRDKEVSYKLNSTLDVYPIWTEHNTEFLLKFQLRSPHLLGKGTHLRAEYKPLPSMWDVYPSTEFYAHWKTGLINEIYIDPSKPVEVLTFQRSLISIFQFDLSNDHSNETDISGTCEVFYEVLSEAVIRKIKRACSWGEHVSGEVSSRRLTRYSLDDAGAPLEVYAEEVHEQGGVLGDSALKARAWLKLRRVSAVPAPVTSGALRDALQSLPAALQPLPLAMPAPTNDEEPKLYVQELMALLEESAEALGGTVQSADADVDAEAEMGAEKGTEVGGGVLSAVRLLSALRVAPPPALAELLQRAAGSGYGGHQQELSYALGLSGSAAALEAVRDQLLEPEDSTLAFRFLDGFTHAAAPSKVAVLEVLRVGEETARADVADRALLAAAAAAVRVGVSEVRDRLQQALQRCQDEHCSATRLRALGYLRNPDLTDTLLHHAEHGEDAAALAAINALTALPERALYNATRLRRLERVARGRGPLQRRAAALHLLLRRSAPAPLTLLPLMSALRHESNEVRRLAWQALDTLAAEYYELRRLHVPLSLRLGGWVARAAPAHSTLLVHDAGGAAGWRGRLQYSLVADGALRRAELALSVTSPDDASDGTVSVQWATGEKPLVDGNESGSNDGPNGEVSLTIGAVRAQHITLNSTKAVLRSLLPLADVHVVLPLLGAGVLRFRRRGAVALAVDLEAATGASCQVELQAALAVEAEAMVRGAWGELHARSRVMAAPRVDVAARGDCVRGGVWPWRLRRELAMRSALGATRWSVRRRRTARLRQNGRSLLLSTAAVCAHLHQ